MVCDQPFLNYFATKWHIKYIYSSSLL